MEIKKIRKMGPHKIVYIPKESSYEVGDLVKVIKIKDEVETQI